jgi:MarR family transcriptional regulator, organic hydroperoxide resistance regulator
VIDAEYPGSVILALHRATHATLHALTTALADLDLPAADIDVLAILADGAGRTVGALATATATRPSTLTSQLDRLTKRGYIARELDPADRRSFLISLTPAGRAVAEHAAAAIADLERQALSTVTPAQRAGFHTVIDALTEVTR